LDFAKRRTAKRVVEFGLTITEELYVKNGKARYFAVRYIEWFRGGND
jgi:hypothetical protein